MRRSFPAEDIHFQLNTEHNYLTCTRTTWDGIELKTILPTISLFNNLIVPDLIVLINHMASSHPPVSTVFTIRNGVVKGGASDATVMPLRKASDATVLAEQPTHPNTQLQVNGLRRLSSTIRSWFLRVIFCYDPTQY